MLRFPARWDMFRIRRAKYVSRLLRNHDGGWFRGASARFAAVVICLASVAAAPGIQLNWAEDLSAPDDVTYQFTDVHAIGSDVYLSGYTRSGLNGVAWKRIGGVWSNLQISGVSYINTIHGTGSSDIWVGGNSGVHHYDGATWSSVPAGVSGEVKKIVALNASNVVALSVSGSVRMTTNGGTSWTGITGGRGGTTVGLLANGTDDIWIGGYDGSTYVQHWNGTTYDATYDMTPGSFVQAVAQRGTNIYASGTGGEAWKLEGSLTNIVENDWRDLEHLNLLAPGVGADMLSNFIENDLQDLPLPASGAAWLAGRDALRTKVIDLLGLTGFFPPPPSWNLNLQYKGTINQTGYRIEKITYESYPGYAVSALLYIPDGITNPVPGIVSAQGHEYAWGKAADFIQARNVNLVKRGCIVLCYDYYDCGERNTGPDPFGGSPYGGGNSHSIDNFFYSRINPTSLEVLDGVRALDVLESLPDVDAARLGFTGESGGGNSTYYISAIDTRVKLTVPVSSVTTYEYWIRKNRNWDWHQRPYGMRSAAEIGTLLALHAPNPLLVIVSLDGTDNNEFPLAEGLRSFNWADQVYTLLGASNVTSFVESSTGHGYQQDKRQTMYAAVEQHLQPPFPAGSTELPVIQQTFAELTSGLSSNNLTTEDIYIQIKAVGPAVPATDADSRSRLQVCLGFPDPLPAVISTPAGGENHSEWSAEFWLVETEPGISIPCKMFGKTNAADRVVMVPDWDLNVLENAYDAGYFALTFDPRGVGEISGTNSNNWTWLAGRRLPAMQAFDMLQVAQFCHAQYPGLEVTIDARSTSSLGWPAFFAGASVENLFHSGVVKITSNLHDIAIPRLPGILDISDIEALWAQLITNP